MANSKAEMMSQARAISGKMKNQTPGGSNAYKSVMGKAAEMKAKAAEAGKAKEAQKFAMVDKLKSAMATRQSADSGKVQAMKAQADAAKARQVAKAPAAKPAMPARPMGGGMGARPTGGTSGGMGGGMKAALDKAIANRPAPAPARPAGRMSGLGAAVRGGAPAPKVGGTGGGMGSMFGSKSFPARPGMAMKKGGKAGKK